MSTEARKLATAIEQTVQGPVWHGDALSALLADVDPTDAAHHAIPGAHSIWELVLHIASWAKIAEQRLRAEPTEEPDDDTDWPPVGRRSAARWTAAGSRLLSAHASLATAVSLLRPEALDERVPGRRYTIRVMLQGVVEHGAYHGGQIALLKRACDTRRPS
jgi:uncharacterized damage-inducible protein DinB